MPHFRTSVSRRRDRVTAAVTFCHKLRGASQPVIVLTTGANLWVVKFRGFGGPKALMSEVVGAEIMSRMGLPVPEWQPILCTDEFLDRNQAAWYSNSSGEPRFRPDAGVHFGSRLVLSETANPTYQIISPLWADRISNRDDFVGALVFDLWANNCDRRQSVFLSGREYVKAVFIDNDHLFGGEHDQETNARFIIAHYQPFYAGLRNQRLVDCWRRKVDGIADSTLEDIFARVPPEWADPGLVRWALDELARRRSRLDRLLSEASAYINTSARTCDFVPIPAL